MLSKYSFLISLYLVCGLLQVVSGCASLPSKEAVLRKSARGPGAPQVKDAQGRLSAQERKRVLERAAGNTDDAEYLKQFILAEQRITGSPLVAGNRVTLLVDGPAAYKAMFDAIKQAKYHIHLETYVLADDAIGKQLADLMLERRAAGVEVKLIYDSIGSIRSSYEFFDGLRKGGVRVHEFHPVNPTKDLRFWRFTQRDHRKLLIVDGKVAFTGGINISDVYSSGSSSGRPEKHATESRWRDTHVRIEGPAVAEFQKLFLRIWAEEEENGLAEHNFPPLQNVGHELVRVVASTGGEDEYSIYKAYLAAISLARERIWVTQAYFTPNDEFIDALKDAARRRVDVRILLPGFSDHKMVLYASRAHYTELLKAGIKLYERKDRLLHAKTAVIDGLWSTVGSSNLDYFSFLRNNEANAVILGQNFGRQMEDLFQSDLTHAQSIDLEKWKKRPPWERLREKFSVLFKYWF
jgi:cardiolipin synthase